MIAWLDNYLSGRTRSVKSDNRLSQPLPICKGVQCSILAPILFSIDTIKISYSVGNASIYLYADNTVLYSAGPCPDAVLKTFQESFRETQVGFLLPLYPVLPQTAVYWAMP